MEEQSIRYNNFNKTRIAPTPSGFLHLGNVLSFGITAFIAKQTGARILLRVDDIDRLRTNEDYVQDIFDTLDFLEIPWDEGPRDINEFEEYYSQLHRIPNYNEAIAALRTGGLVYACNCSRKYLEKINGENGSVCECYALQIPLSSENTNWRLIADKDAEISIRNINGEIIKSSLPTDMHHIIVRKKDGFPSYQLTSVIDDLFYGIDLVIRGQDLWPSTLAQYQLAEALGGNDFNKITFYHHPLLMDTPDKKLSKSAGATSVRYLRQNGKSAKDIYTLIAGMLAVDTPVNSWEQLGEIAMKAIR